MARKKSTRKNSPIKQAYVKERKRIQRQIQRMEDRGYVSTKDMLPPVPKRITEASVRRLKKITTKQLYDYSDYMDLTTGEVVSSGAEARAKERSVSAKKAAQTRKEKRILAQKQKIRPVTNETESQHIDSLQQVIERNRQVTGAIQFQRTRARKDTKDRRRLTTDEVLNREFSVGVMILSEVERTIEQIEKEYGSQLASYAKQALDEAKAEDYAGLIDRLEKHPEAIEALQDSYYKNKSGDHFRPTAFNHFISIIKGKALSAEETKDVQDAYEQRMMLFDVDEGITD